MLGRIDISLTGPVVGQAGYPRINEGEAFRLTIRPLSENLAATTPSTLRYRIDDLEQRSTILDWTTLTPSTSVQVIITSAQNAMRNSLNRERRQITVEATDADGPIRKTLDYSIVDLQGV